MITVHNMVLKPKVLTLLSHGSLLNISKYIPYLCFCLELAHIQSILIFVFKVCFSCAIFLFSILNADMTCLEHIGRRHMHAQSYCLSQKCTR